jgi:hypothetical protein
MLKFRQINPVYKNTAKLLLAACFLSVVLYKLDLPRVIDMIAEADPYLLLFASLLLFSRPVLGACRWRVLLNARTQPPRLLRMIRHYLIGSFFAFFLPATAGSDLARGYGAHRDGADATISAGSVIIERWLGLSCLLWLASFSAIYAGNSLEGLHIRTVLAILVFVWMLMLAAFLLRMDQYVGGLFGPFIRKKLSVLFRLAEEIRHYMRCPYSLVKAAVYSILIHLVSITSAFLVSRAIGGDTLWIYFLILLPIVWIISMLPVSMNGLGLREGSFIFLFHAVGMSTETAGAVAILILAQNILIALIGGLFFVAHRPIHMNRPCDKNQVPA